MTSHSSPASACEHCGAALVWTEVPPTPPYEREKRVTEPGGERHTAERCRDALKRRLVAKDAWIAWDAARIKKLRTALVDLKKACLSGNIDLRVIDAALVDAPAPTADPRTHRAATKEEDGT